VLLVACALTTRGVQRGAGMDVRFVPGPVLVTEVDLPASSYDRRATAVLMKGVLDDVGQAPGVAAAALTAFVPLGNSRSTTSVRPPAREPHEASRALSQTISARYFEVLGIPIVTGRTFTAADETGRPVLVNETMARRLWPEQSPLGQQLVVGDGRAREVIGVVRDAYTTDLDQIEPTAYLPYTTGRAALLVRSADGRQASTVLRTILERREPRARASSYPLTSNVDRSLRSARTGAALAAGLGLLALLLATVGVFGVVAYAVEQRTREIGVRMALGATRRQVVRFVLAANTRAVLAGLAAGLLGSLLASPLLESRLFGVSRLDPVAYGAVLALLACAGVAATIVPARRATRIDPMIALRWD
jgi:putative ABC transport system permease protein